MQLDKEEQENQNMYSSVGHWKLLKQPYQESDLTFPWRQIHQHPQYGLFPVGC